MKWLYDMKIATKLSLSFMAVLCLMAFLGVFSLHKLSEANLIVSKNIIKEWLPNIISASDMNTNASGFRIAEFEHVFSPLAEDKQKQEKNMQDILVRFDKNTADYEVWMSSDTERRVYNEFRTKWTAYLKKHEALLALSRANKTDAAVVLLHGEL